MKDQRALIGLAFITRRAALEESSNRNKAKGSGEKTRGVTARAQRVQEKIELEREKAGRGEERCC